MSPKEHADHIVRIEQKYKDARVKHGALCVKINKIKARPQSDTTALVTKYCDHVLAIAEHAKRISDLTIARLHSHKRGQCECSIERAVTAE